MSRPANRSLWHLHEKPVAITGFSSSMCWRPGEIEQLARNCLVAFLMTEQTHHAATARSMRFECDYDHLEYRLPFRYGNGSRRRLRTVIQQFGRDACGGFWQGFAPGDFTACDHRTLV